MTCGIMLYYVIAPVMHLWLLIFTVLIYDALVWAVSKYSLMCIGVSELKIAKTESPSWVHIERPLYAHLVSIWQWAASAATFSDIQPVCTHPSTGTIQEGQPRVPLRLFTCNTSTYIIHIDAINCLIMSILLTHCHCRTS